MGGFFDKFNMFSDEEFSFLKMSCVNVFLSSQTAEFCFVCPEDKFDFTLSSILKIKSSVEKAFESLLKITVKITKSHFDEHFFTLDLIRFFSFYASLNGCLDKRDVKYAFDAKTSVRHVSIVLKESAYQVFCGRGLMRELSEFIHSNYCENIEAQVLISDEPEQFDEGQSEKYSYDDKSGRFIRVINAEGLIGYTIFDLASYICDATPCEKAVLCGKIRDIKEVARKPKDGKEKPNFYKFLLDDTTGSVEAVYFPTEKTKEKFALLKDGSQIIADGKLEFNVFNEKKTLTFYPRRISLCGFPEDFKVNRLKLNIPAKYKNIFPKMYGEFKQASFFGNNETESDIESDVNNNLESCMDPNMREINSDTEANDLKINNDKKQNFKTEDKIKAETGMKAFLAGSGYSDIDNKSACRSKFFKERTFCVFDIETTGLDRHNDKIIEIGAVKIENGVLTETFSTFVDPQILLPEKITKLTGITSADIKDAFLLEEILPDLLKFFGDSILVGHNIELFDFPFLSNAALKYNAYFDNKKLDTYLLAKQYLTLNQYRLKDVTEYFNIKNTHAHRALDDAVATAKVFIAMSEFFDFEL